MKQVVEETVLLIPHLVLVYADTIHGIGNPDEILKEAIGDVFVRRVMLGEDERNFEHGKAIERHPCRAIRLIHVPAARQWRTAIKDADVIQPKKPSRKNVSSRRILAIHPPGKVQPQFME